MIQWKNIKLILMRELRDQLRDRRTLFMVAILPLLLYPATQHEGEPVCLEIRDAGQRVGARIRAMGIHIPRALAEARSGTCGAVGRLVMEILAGSLPVQGSHAS